MDVFYEKILRPIFFTQDAEKAHELAIKVMSLVGSIAPLRSAMERFNLVKSGNPTKLFGIEFPNKVGLAAGFDKDAHAWRGGAAFGFGHIEIGTVTAHKQAGNPKPRVFRYPKYEAIVNSFGFPNDGASEVGKRLKRNMPSVKKIPVGINIGKSKITPLDDAVVDYLESFNTLADYADFFVLNVSSPNTPELRKLQGTNYLPELLSSVRSANEDRAKKLGKCKIPLLLKIAPDLSYKEIDDILSVLIEVGYDGIVATNTTVTRPEYMGEVQKVGGLSGKPLFEKSLEVVRYVSESLNGRIPVIGVGGITNTDCAAKMLDAGADLIQIYSGLIYRGSFFARELAKSLKWRDNKDWL